MAIDRFYIYRSGKTKDCALTRVKDDPRLPPNGWQFWMQATGHQSEDGRYGFNWEEAVREIAAKGYYLFTGSMRLSTDGSPPNLQQTKRTKYPMSDAYPLYWLYLFTKKTGGLRSRPLWRHSLIGTTTVP